MSRSAPFFIRAKVNTANDNSFDQVSIDLGAYVDALGKSVLRVHNVAATVANASNNYPPMPGAATADMSWQITTQSQTDLVDPDDKSLVSSGSLRGVAPAGELYESGDQLPQHWTNGYLIGVEQIYLGAKAETNWSTTSIDVTVVLECTVETLTQSAAMALALSQQ